ncbi:uncharacterized protein [Zea mays]|uniref:uncharacterized protein n=1 Tax=Zea mays TaxID=4577 RepID=UPI0004DEBC3B|nr:uncharacterized protein LOC103649151 [Zea mays]|eukprot:XP_008671707.1 uncharacterized protein LOC103649151 [Zea mays]
MEGAAGQMIILILGIVVAAPMTFYTINFMEMRDQLKHPWARDYNSDDEDSRRKVTTISTFTSFEQGYRVFHVAFLKIMSKKLPDDPLGPILSARKTLAAAKLVEVVEENKPKGEAQKEKRVAAEKGHAIPKDHLDNKEKELIKAATKGVVRLFNAVSTLTNLVCSL